MVKRLILILLLSSCSIKRDVLKDNTETKETKTEIVTSKRPEETINISVPKVIYKDTTIVRKGKTTYLTMRYDKQGGLDVDCVSKEIDELKKVIYNLEKKNDIKTVEKETMFNTSFFVSLFIALIILVIINKKL
jgi:hypothetical protein|tara:strand:- start:33 stop:434 length:402 start_codon:yes stop_codon:yes gene_type:complete